MAITTTTPLAPMGAARKSCSAANIQNGRTYLLLQKLRCCLFFAAGSTNHMQAMHHTPTNSQHSKNSPCRGILAPMGVGKLTHSWCMLLRMLSLGGGSMKSNSSRLSTLRLFSRSTTLDRLVRWISGTLLTNISCLKADSEARQTQHTQQPQTLGAKVAS